MEPAAAHDSRSARGGYGYDGRFAPHFGVNYCAANPWKTCSKWRAWG